MLLLTGFNHHTAPVDLRERAAPTCNQHPGASEMLAAQLAADERMSEFILLATCNRVELYAVTDEPFPPHDRLHALFAELCDLNIEVLRPHLYDHPDERAAAHLMEVAAGLDSMVLGESQILGQVRRALEEAQQAELTGPVLSRLFTRAIHGGKRAHRETEIGRHPTSISHSAAQLVRHYLAAHGGGRVLIIGAGEMARLAGRVLSPYPLDIRCINRTDTRAAQLAEEIGASARPWAALPESLVWADAVITATAATEPILLKPMLQEALETRRSRPMMLIDVALPRDVAPEARELPSLHYRDLDDLQRLAATCRIARDRAISEIGTIIKEETAYFMAWYHARRVSPLIAELRGWAQQLAAQEVQRALNKLPDADPHTHYVVEQLGHRLTNQILHQPTVQLRTQAANGHATRYDHAVRALFDLDPEETKR